MLDIDDLNSFAFAHSSEMIKRVVTSLPRSDRIRLIKVITRDQIDFWAKWGLTFLEETICELDGESNV